MSGNNAASQRGEQGRQVHACVCLCGPKIILTDYKRSTPLRVDLDRFGICRNTAMLARTFESARTGLRVPFHGQLRQVLLRCFTLLFRC